MLCTEVTARCAKWREIIICVRFNLTAASSQGTLRQRKRFMRVWLSHGFRFSDNETAASSGIWGIGSNIEVYRKGSGRGHGAFGLVHSFIRGSEQFPGG